MPYRIITGVLPGIFYGWVLVAVVFLVAGTAAGLIYAFPAFFDSIATTFNASRAQVSAIFAGAEFVWFMSGFLGGYLADRIGPARVVLLGSVAFFVRRRFGWPRRAENNLLDGYRISGLGRLVGAISTNYR